VDAFSGDEDVGCGVVLDEVVVVVVFVVLECEGEVEVDVDVEVEVVVVDEDVEEVVELDPAASKDACAAMRFA
jgi:hypothetical protein